MGPACECSERRRPLTVQAGSNDRPRQWVVLGPRNRSCSAFNGYRSEWSAKSLICCRVCGSAWRTAGAFVDHLLNAPEYPGRLPESVPPYEELAR